MPQCIIQFVPNSHKDILQENLSEAYSELRQILQMKFFAKSKKVVSYFRKKDPVFFDRVLNTPLNIRSKCLLDAFITLHNSFMTETLLYRNHSIDMQSKSMYWFLYDKDLRHERAKALLGGLKML